MFLSWGAFSQLTAPFIESFNNGTTLPGTWTNSIAPGGTGSAWRLNGNMGYSGSSIQDHTGIANSQRLWIDHSSTDRGVLYTSDTIDVSMVPIPELSFFYNTFLGTNPCNPFNSLFVEAYDGANWVILDEINQDNSGVWSEHYYNLCKYIFATDKVMVRFRAEDGAQASGSAFYMDQAIDDIAVDTLRDNCTAASQFTARNITATTATLAWTGGCTDSAYDVEYGPLGFTPGTGTTVSVLVDTLDVTGLTALTNYDFYVTVYCNGGFSTAAAGPGTFLTACATQLNGLYTLDPSAPVSPTNFVLMADFMSFIANCGVSGPTTLDVAVGSGPHIINTDLAAYNGMSATNTVTLNGNGETINRGAGTYFLALNGVEYFTINDFNFVNETPNSQMYGIMMRGGCDNITIKNNTIDVGTGYTTSLSCGICATNSVTSPSSNGDNANNVTIDSNTIIGAYYGVSLRGQSTAAGSRSIGHKVTNNSFEDQSVYGLYSYASDSILIDHNDFSRSTRTNNASYYGLYNWYSTSSVTTNNRVHAVQSTSTCYPMYIGYNTNTAATPGIIANNAVYDITNTGTFYGIYLYSFSTAATGGNNHINIWHNTVTRNTTGTTSTTRGISVNSTTTSYINNIDLTNNIVDIYGSGSGTKYAVYFPTVATFSGSNNVLYNGATAGTNNLGYFGANQATLAAWNTASGQTNNSDVNPIIIAPNFTPFSTAIDDFGTPLALVTIDIDGVTRNATTPDAGAIEFVPSGGDLAIVGGGLIQIDDCYGTNDTAWVNIDNLFGDTMVFATAPLTVYFEVTGPINTTITTVVSTDTLFVGDRLRVFNSNIDMSTPGKYSFKAYIDFSATNILNINDTLTSIDESEVKPLLAVTPTFDTLYSLLDSSKLSTQSPFYPAGAFLITEICQFAGASNGRPTAGKPSWMITDDYIEITGVPGSDLAGITFEQWTTSTQQSSFTFPSGTVLSPNGTAIIATSQVGSQTNDPSNFIYLGNGAYTGTNGSSTTSGKVLRDASGAVIDAVGYYGYGTFPAAAGVTAADWSAPLTHTSGTWGIRLTSADNNTGSNWVLSTGPLQDPNVLNSGVPLPSPSSVNGLTWTDLTTMTVIDTTPEIYAKGFTANGTYPIEAAFITPCGTYRDTAFITVLNQTYDTTIINSCDSFIMPLTNRVQYATGFFTDTLVSTGMPTYDSIFYVYDVNIDTTNETITQFACDSFTSPSGKIWNTSGTYLDTIVNSLGCDSLMVFNLTVNYISYDTLTLTVCDTFIAPSGAVFRTTGSYYDTILNAGGCDSAMTINLTVLNSTTSMITRIVCDSFVGPAGMAYTTTGIYNDTLTNSIGCDSVIVINLTVHYSTSRTDNIVLCAGQTHRVGPSVYSTAGTYTDLFSTFYGCDSTVITNLSFFAPAVATINYNFCTGDSVQVLGNWYYSATVVMDTIVGGSSNGCDSVTTHNITTRTVSPALNLGNDVSSCLDGGVTIFASNAYDTYNWSNGGTTNVLSVNGATAGAGSTDHILTVTQASSGCTARDTVNITFQSCVGLSEADVDLNISLYPNPATNFVTIEVYDRYNTGNLKLEITNSLGQVVSTQTISSASQKVIMDVNNFSKGLYFVKISSDKVFMTKKLLIQK